MPRSQREGDEAAEPVGDDVGLSARRERGKERRDAIRIILDGRAGRRRPSESRQRGQEDPAAFRERNLFVSANALDRA